MSRLEGMWRFQEASWLITKVRSIRGVWLVSQAQYSCPVELGLVIGKGGRDIQQADAENHIAGYGARIPDIY